MVTNRQIDYARVPDPAYEALMSAETDQPSDAPAGVPEGFRRALQAAEVGLWQWDLRTGAVELSPVALLLLRRSRMQVANYPGLIAALYPEDRVVAERALRTSVASAGSFDFDVRS